MTHSISRRSVTTGLAAAVTAAPIAALASHTDQAAPLEDRVRAFAHKLLTDPPEGIRVSEWIERKRIGALLQAMIGDKPEPWTPGELSMMREMANR